MSFYNKSSLLTIPTAYKQGKLYSAKPTDGSGDFTFTRSTSATRVNEAGLIEKGRENLLLQSNSFSTTPWVLNNGVTLTSGQAGYDGSSNAWLLTKPASGFTNVAQAMSTSGVVTFSIYAKAGTLSTFNLRMIGTDEDVLFDLSAGSVSTSTSGVIHSEITAISSGWYRCSFSAVWGSGVQLGVYAGDVPDSTAGNIYIQDVQLEAGLVATDYIETTTTTVSTGIVENVPRIDYSSGTPALLLEPQRTNLVLQSEDFGNYININSTDVSNVTISPEGFTNATSFLEAATTGQHKLFTSFNFDGTSTYTFSIFAKHNGRDLFIDTQNSNEWSGRAWFDLTNGTANAILGTAAIEDFGNGWYRCIVTGISNIAGANFVELLTSDGSTNIITGDITKGVYIYGCQLEQGSYATSYIPTYGTSVTRVAENVINTNTSGIIGQVDGMIYLEMSALSDDGTFRQVTLSDGTSANLIHFDYSSSSNELRVFTRKSGVASSFTYTMTDTTSNSKFALKYADNDYRLFINGVKVATNTTCLTPLNLSDIEFDNGSGSNNLEARLNQFMIFPTALTDQEAIDLTTL